MNLLPTSSCRNIAKVSEILLSHCEKYNFQIWAEFGTLIGILRHNFVIPWDYDGDFGMWQVDQERFISTFQQDHNENSPCKLDLGYYNDSGCCALYLKESQDDIVDLVFYSVQDKKVVSCQSPETLRVYPSKTDYSYPSEYFFPLQEKLYLGHRVWIFGHPGTLLEKDYGDEYGGWQHYPPDKQDYILPKYCDSPFLPIPEISAKTFDQLISIIELAYVPQIFRKTPLLEMGKDQYSQIIDLEPEIYGYISSITWNYSTHPGKQLWDEFLNNKLSINIVDSPITDTSSFDSEWKQYAFKKLGDHAHLGLTWILTCSPKVTHFHTDPSFAGGYMKLLEGDKIWWCVIDEDLTYLEKAGHTISSLSQLSFVEILSLENYYLWGKIYVGRITDSDLIWFPIRCLHKVITLKSSYGFGGYL